jgi:N-acyl-phosphatidylethanolamine-hydrolysing phospholipase D
LRLAAALLLVLLTAGCAGVGPPVPGAPAHHRANGFANVNASYEPASAWTRFTFFITRIFAATFSPRTANFPQAASNLPAILDNRGAATVTWVGHATLLVQLDGVNILTDPNWSKRASPVSFAGPKRVAPPGLTFENLPPIHVVVISHDHYDHLDVVTVKRLAAEHRPKFLVPLRLKQWFADIGITDVEELDWWDHRVLNGLTFTCVPAQHFSGRTLWDRNRRLWGGWVVAGKTKRLYFAGDTAYFDGFKEIAARLGPFDLVAMPIGAYVPAVIMRASHTTPEEALQAFADVRGQHFVPIHWGTFDLAEEPLDEPPKRLVAEAHRLRLALDRIWVLQHGQTRLW